MIQKTVRQQAKQEQGKEMPIPTADFAGQGEELLKDAQYHNQRVLFNSESRETPLRSWRKDPQATEWLSEFPQSSALGLNRFLKQWRKRSSLFRTNAGYFFWKA